MAEGDKKLQLIHDAIESQTKRIDEFVKVSGRAIEVSTQTKIEIATVSEQIKNLCKNVENLNEKIDKGNGFSTRITRVETAFSECSKRSSGKWKILWTAFALLVVSILAWLITDKILVD